MDEDGDHGFLHSGGAGWIEGFEYVEIDQAIVDGVHGLMQGAGFYAADIDYMWVKKSKFVNTTFD